MPNDEATTRKAREVIVALRFGTHIGVRFIGHDEPLAGELRFRGTKSFGLDSSPRAIPYAALREVMVDGEVLFTTEAELSRANASYLELKGRALTDALAELKDRQLNELWHAVEVERNWRRDRARRGVR